MFLNCWHTLLQLLSEKAVVVGLRPVELVPMMDSVTDKFASLLCRGNSVAMQMNVDCFSTSVPVVCLMQFFPYKLSEQIRCYALGLVWTFEFDIIWVHEQCHPQMRLGCVKTQYKFEWAHIKHCQQCHWCDVPHEMQPQTRLTLLSCIWLLLDSSASPSMRSRNSCSAHEWKCTYHNPHRRKGKRQGLSFPEKTVGRINDFFHHSPLGDTGTRSLWYE